MNPFCWQDYWSGTLEAIAAKGAAFQPAKLLQSHHKGKLPKGSSAAPIPCHLPAPLPLTWSAQAVLCSHSITMCQSKDLLLDQGKHSTATALHSCSLWVLAPGSSWEQHHCLPRRKREWFSSDGSITFCMALNHFQNLPPPKGTPPLPKGAAKAWKSEAEDSLQQCSEEVLFGNMV